MAYANLIQAAQGCQTAIMTRWAAGTVKANLTAFLAAIAPSFDDTVQGDRTVGNWIVLLQAATVSISTQQPFPLAYDARDEQLIISIVGLVYRLCWQALQRQGNGISVTQGTAVLTAMNANLT